MLSERDFFDYQRRAVDHAAENPRSMVFLFMSAGKTIIALTSIRDRIDRGEVVRALVVAPLRVAEFTWRQEAVKWAHTQHLNVRLLRGKPEDRLRSLVDRSVDVHVINYEQLAWLSDTVRRYFRGEGRPVPWNMLVLDEVDRFKDCTGKRFDTFEHLLLPEGIRPKHQYAPDPSLPTPFPYRMGLTGTPASNGLVDLHGQFRAIDGGKRLYFFLGDFRAAFCSNFGAPDEQYARWTVRNTAAREEIQRRIADITLSLNEKDHIKLPDYMIHDHWVDLPPKIAADYKLFEKNMFVAMARHELDPLDGELEVESESRSSARTKCRQLANGALKGEEGKPMLVHDAKLEVLDQIMHEAQGKPVLLAYVFRADMHRIMQRYGKKYRVAYVGPGSKDTEQVLTNWNKGEYHMLMSHPACLHPMTEVLTEHRGWATLISVRPWERVFDGEEFVSHQGCVFSGSKDVINVFGIVMTPDHKLLVDGDWVAAKDVGSIKRAKRKALYRHGEFAVGLSAVSELRGGKYPYEAKRCSKQPHEQGVLRRVFHRQISFLNRNPNMADMVWDESTLQWNQQREFVPELLRQRGKGLRKMGILRELLRRYARRVLGRIDPRPHQHERPLLQRELPLGHERSTAIEQTQQPKAVLPRRMDAPGRVVPPNGTNEGQTDGLFEQDTGRRPRSRGGDELVVQQRDTTKAPVYDLVNCGPRHRFLIRNDAGEVFVSHNSISHGLNLQFGGCDIVWFGPTDNLRYYLQFNARLRRVGQKSESVHVRRILARDTVDEVTAQSLDEKDADEQTFRRNLEAYRARKTGENPGLSDCASAQTQGSRG